MVSVAKRSIAISQVDGMGYTRGWDAARLSPNGSCDGFKVLIGSIRLGDRGIFSADLFPLGC